MNNGITINANELRIGNYVMLDTGHTLPMPHAILPDDLMRLWKHDFPDNIIIEPIPLSRSILEKCGFAFKERGYNKVYQIPIGNAMFLLEIHDGKYFFSPYEVNHQIEVKYLHQLQNLYYALTQTELKIQL